MFRNEEEFVVIIRGFVFEGVCGGMIIEFILVKGLSYECVFYWVFVSFFDMMVFVNDNVIS